MSKSRSVLGIAVLFALALSAFSAANASALGTTAFTCVSGGTEFEGAHCLSGGGGAKEFKHVALTENPTSITATNANTAVGTTASRPSILSGTLAGVKTKLECTTTHGTGTLENKVEGEMVAHAEGILTYSGCSVLEPAGKGCVVKGGTVETAQLTGITKGPAMNAEIKPKVPSTFATITIEGCSVSALNNPFPVTGSLVAEITGATVTSTSEATTTQNTLKFGGNKAGLDGALTLKGPGASGSGNPIVVTTE